MIRLVYLDTGHNRSKRNHLLAVVSTNSIRHILIIAHLLPCLVHTRSLTVYMCVYICIHTFQFLVMIAYSLNSIMQATYCNSHWMMNICRIHRSFAPVYTQMHWEELLPVISNNDESNNGESIELKQKFVTLLHLYYVYIF